jgi:hypothetical protein
LRESEELEMKKVPFELAAVALLVGWSNQSWATSLTPGFTTVPGFQSTSGFVVLADTGSQPFNLGDGTTGSLDARVGTLSTNPYGGLTFAYQFSVSSGLVEHLSSASFANFLTDVAFDNSAQGTVAPSTTNRSGNTDNGRVVEFNGEWIVGATSAVLLINTNAQFFATGTIGIIDGGGQTLTGFAPLVPEPASFFLLASCLISLGGVSAWRVWKS